MKRLFAVLLVAALVMGGAFAQISFGAWGRGVFVPVQGGAGVEDPTATTMASWGGNPRIGFTIRGESDNIGFQVDMTGNLADIGVGDNARIWWKANDMFKVLIGKTQGDALRGKISDAPLGGMIFGWRNKDNDALFTRFYPQRGALVEITPMDGLFIGASVDTNLGDGSPAPVKDVYTQTLQVGAGYNIDGIGHIRVQYVGGAIGTNGIPALVYDGAGDVISNGGRIEAAFALGMIDGVTIDIGGKIPFDSDKMGYTAMVGAAANFAIDNIGVTARVDATIADPTTNIQIYAIPSFGLDFATIGLDGVVEMNMGDETYVGFGVAPWIKKGYSNGYVQLGVAFTKGAWDGAELGWSVPVIFEYWF